MVINYNDKLQWYKNAIFKNMQVHSSISQRMQKCIIQEYSGTPSIGQTMQKCIMVMQKCIIQEHSSTQSTGQRIHKCTI